MQCDALNPPPGLCLIYLDTSVLGYCMETEYEAESETKLEMSSKQRVSMKNSATVSEQLGPVEVSW